MFSLPTSAFAVDKMAELSPLAPNAQFNDAYLAMIYREVFDDIYQGITQSVQISVEQGEKLRNDLYKYYFDPERESGTDPHPGHDEPPRKRENPGHTESCYQEAEEFIARCPVRMYLQDAPMYSYDHDIIYIPHHSRFVQIADYYQILFHELGHWARCKLQNEISLEDEIIVEIASCFLCRLFDIRPSYNQSVYYVAEQLYKRRMSHKHLFALSAKAIDLTEAMLNQ